MHPLFLEKMADEHQCDLYLESRAAGGPAHLKGTVGGRLRRALSGRRRERDPSTVVTGC